MRKNTDQKNAEYEHFLRNSEMDYDQLNHGRIIEKDWQLISLFKNIHDPAVTVEPL